MVLEERGERPIGRPRLVELVAGPEIAAEVQVRDGEQVVRPLRERSHSLPHPPQTHLDSPPPLERALSKPHAAGVRSLFRRRDKSCTGGAPCARCRGWL